MLKNKFQLILGSGSPRRQELLRYTFLPFKIHTSEIEEVSALSRVKEIVCDLATQKAQAVFDNIKSDYDNPLVLGADTIVSLDNKILGKPESESHARETLMQLSGRKHEVLTGVCLLSSQKNLAFYAKTEVEFEHITEDLLDHYIKTGESMDKAGAYGIQAYSLGFIGNIHGSYSNVVGLPVNLVLAKIKEFVGETDSKDGQWRNYFE